MIDFAAHAIVAGGLVVALLLAAFFFAAAIGEALDTILGGALARLTAPDVEARGTVIEVASLVDRLRPLDPPSGGMAGGDGWRSR